MYKPIDQYRVKFDAMNSPLIVNIETGETWHIGHRVTHTSRPVNVLIDSFYLDGVYTRQPIKGEHDNRTFMNVKVLLIGIDGVKLGYTDINMIKSLETPNFSYSTEIKQKPIETNYFYILIG